LRIFCQWKVNRPDLGDACRSANHMKHAFFLFLALVSYAASADETASTPYSAFLKASQIDVSDIEGVQPGIIQFKVRSTLPDVEPTDIELRLLVEEQSAKIEVSPRGTFDLPISKSLAERGARLVTNQPVKTAVFGVSLLWHRTDVTFDRTETGARVKYAKLFPSPKVIDRTLNVLDKLKINEELASARAKPYRKVDSVVFEYQGRHESTEVVVDFGDRTVDVTPVSVGKYRIEYRLDWADLEPWIRVSPAESWGLEYEYSTTDAAHDAEP